MKLYEEAGMPPGVINLVYGSGAEVGDPALASRDLAGIHFTGSTGVFNGMWSSVASNLGHYRNYPRIVGETGGKDFIVAHASADVDSLATAIVRGSFEYQGQKRRRPASSRRRISGRSCGSGSSRRSARCAWATWPTSRNFMGAVIDQSSFATQKAAIDEATSSGGHGIGARRRRHRRLGGLLRRADGDRDERPNFRTMRDELFGPVVTAYVYDEKRYDETLDLVDAGAPYGLTGACFARDRAAVEAAKERLRYAAGNFYVNDKPTGAVVGQQPFGGARASGTNDKAGSMWNLIRWVSPRTIKETFVPPTDYRYPFLEPDA